MNANAEIKLAPPGAGLPGVELQIARLLFVLRRWTGSRDSFNAVFKREQDTIQNLVRQCDADSLSRRVFIKRLPGLEDSSRYWSVLMTLDHLRIVNLGIAKTISALTSGVIPPGAASTARVKPSEAVNVSVVPEFESSCAELLNTVAAVPKLKTPGRYRHPWFGLLDASGWHALAVSHMSIHRTQIGRIIAGIPRI